MRGFAIVALLAASAPAAAGKPAGPRSLAELKTAYLDGLFRAKPHLASFMGDHRFDDRLPDLSKKGLAAREAELAGQQAELAKVDRGKLSLDDRIDAGILDDGIALELLYLREIRDWTWDPRLHDSFPYYDPREIVAARLSDVIHGDYAPDAARRATAIAQLRALPRFLAEARAALDQPSKVYLDQAVRDNRGRVEFFESELKEFLQGDAAGEAARVAAVKELQDFQVFLEKELPPRATRDWKLGAALYAKKFPLALQTTLTPEQVIPRAQAAFREARAELYGVSRRLHVQLWPKEPPPPEQADAKAQARTIARVRDELGRDHAKPAELVAAHARNLDRLRAFIEKHDLLALPPKESLTVVEMPAFKRGSSAAEYLAPGVLDKGRKEFRATYYVDPIDPSWKPERVESYLRGQNDYAVELVAAHEAYPGHHTQFSYERHDLNPLRAVLWNGAMVEGWAVYAEGLLVRLGYGGERSDRYRFDDVKGKMIVAANILLDIQLQSGRMTDEEALRFMVDEGFQEQAQAEKKLLRAKLDSTQLAQYFLGLDEIAELEAEYRKKVGPRYKQRAFNEALIGHGSIAVKHLRSYLLGVTPGGSK